MSSNKQHAWDESKIVDDVDFQAQDAELFKTACIELEVRIYSPVQYPQIHGDFVPGLSILDAVFHFGPRTRGLLQYPSPARGYELQ